MSGMRMTEEKAREIFYAKSLEQYTHAQCVAADQWVKAHAINKFHHVVADANLPGPMRQFIIEMVRCHYGSMEVDNMLTKLKCYPEWLADSRVACIRD